MIDSDLMAARGQEVDTKESVLAGLPLHNAIEAWQYSDDGPPEGEGDKPGDGQLPWVVTTELDDQSSASHSVERTTESSRKLSAIRGNLVRIARADTGSSSYPDLTSEDAADRRAADATAVGTADAIHADLMITKRPYALAGRWRADGVTVCTPAEALAIVGLYLRSQGEFAVYGSAPDRVALSLNRGLYYGSGSRDLLSSGWRWGTACNQHDVDGLGAVAMAVFERFERALRVRDDLLRAVNRVQNNDVADDVSLALDTCLLMVMGAFDSAARVAHAVLNLKGTPYSAGWQRENWWKKLDAANSALAKVVSPADPAKNDPGSDGDALLTVLGLLRNTVHAAGLQSIAFVNFGAPQQTLIALPTVDQQEIVDAADRLGGRAAWGIRELSQGEMFVDPAVLVDQLLPRAAELLNELMDATPVELLSGVTLTPAMSQPPTNDEAYSEECRRCIRWQLGLSD